MIISYHKDIFHIVKTIPFPEIQRVFNGEESKKNKICCPFHQEKTPSFHIYPDSFKCWGCGEHGDGIDFVSKLYELKPLEAARLIAEKFGISIVQGKLPPRLSKKVMEVRQEQALRKGLKAREREAFLRLVNLCELVRETLRNEGLKISDDINYLLQRLPLFECWLDILAAGTEQEKIELLQSDELRWWLYE